MMDIKIFTNGEGGQGGWLEAGGIFLFDMLLYYFINVIIKTSAVSLLFTLYIVLIVNIVVKNLHFPSSEK